MSTLRLALVLALGLSACAAPSRPTDAVDDPTTGDDPTGAAPDTLIIDGLEPGWLVTTTTVIDGQMPVDTTVVSDGSAMSVAPVDGTRTFATVTDGDGAVVATRTVLAACASRPGRQLRVPSQYPTIQAAVNAAHAGDTVAVAPGRYTDSVIMKAGVCLLGSGAATTILDADGESRTLVDLSIAPGSVVSGFTFRGTTSDAGCADHDPFTCSGNWYRAGIYVSGEGLGALQDADPLHKWSGPSQKSPALIYDNVFADNDVGVMLNFNGIGVVRNNVFTGNRSALVANHFQDHTLVANNVFVANHEVAIGNQAAYLDIVGNIIAGSDVAVRFEYVQTGAIRCNLFFHNGADQTDLYDVPPRFTIGQDGNVELDPQFVATEDYHLAPGSPGIDRGCFGGHEPDGSPYDLGVYGGPLAQAISL